MTEPTNAELAALLTDARTVSTKGEAASNENTGRLMAFLQDARAESRAANIEIIKNVANLEGRVTMIANKSMELETRIQRTEATAEKAHRTALGARDSSHDLEGVVLREVTALQLATRFQDKALEEIKEATKDIVADSKARKDAAVERDKTIDRIDKLAKITLGVLGLVAAAWATLEFAIKHFH